MSVVDGSRDLADRANDNKQQQSTTTTDKLDDDTRQSTTTTAHDTRTLYMRVG
jgi:hypothetical protein